MLTLKAIHYSARFSEETIAFSATVCWNGKKVGDAMNRGHGGNTEIDVPATFEQQPEVDAYLKAAYASRAKARWTEVHERIAAGEKVADWEVEMAERWKDGDRDGQYGDGLLASEIDCLVADWLAEKDKRKEANRIARWAKKYATAAAAKGFGWCGYALQGGQYRIIAAHSREGVLGKMLAQGMTAESIVYLQGA